MDPQAMMIQYRLGLLKQAADVASPIPGELRTVLSAVPAPEGWVALDPAITTSISRNPYPLGSPYFPPEGSAPTTQNYPVTGEVGNPLYFRGNCWATDSGKIVYWNGTGLTVEEVCPGAGVVLAYMPFGGNRAAALVRLENGTYGYRRRLNGVWSVVNYGGSRDAPQLCQKFTDVSWAAVISNTQMAFITERFNAGSGLDERVTNIWDFADYTNDPSPRTVLITPANGYPDWERFQGFANVLTSYAWGTETVGSDIYLLLWDMTEATPKPLRVAVSWDGGELRGTFMAETGYVPIALIQEINYFPMRYRYTSGITADGLPLRSYRVDTPAGLSCNGFASGQTGPMTNPNVPEARFLTGGAYAGEGESNPAIALMSGFEGGYRMSFPGLGYGYFSSGTLVVNTSNFTNLLLVGFGPSRGGAPTSLIGITFPTGALDNMMLPASNPGTGKKDLVFLGARAPYA